MWTRITPNRDTFHAVPLVEKVNDLTLKAILKYQNHPSISAIEEKLKKNSVFTFCHITLQGILKEVSEKIIIDNSDIFQLFICESFNNITDSSIFPAVLNLAHITSVFKKGFKNLKEGYTHVNIKDLWKMYV